MKNKKSFIAVWVWMGLLIVSSVPHVNAEDFSLTKLDASLLKERLRKLYGNFNLGASGVWNVSYQGQTVQWKWTGTAWACPQGSPVNCADWVPLSFRWWVMSKGFLDNWSPTKKLGFDIGRPKVVRTKVPIVRASGAEAGTPEATEEETEQRVDPYGGKKWAHEVWQWESKKGTNASIFVSLRDQKIERLNSEGADEYIEWEKGKGTALELDRVTMNRPDLQVSFQRVR